MRARAHTARRTATILVALTAGALLLVGCGGGDDDADATTTTESSSADPTDSDTDSDSSDAPTSGDGSGSFSPEDCEQLASAFEEFDVSESLDGSTDPTEQLREIADQFRAAADDAPADVAADVRTLADVYGELADASADIDWEGLQSGNPAAAAGAARLGQIYADNPDFATAAQNLSAWAAANCVPS